MKSRVLIIAILIVLLCTAFSFALQSYEFEVDYQTGSLILNGPAVTDKYVMVMPVPAGVSVDVSLDFIASTGGSNYGGTVDSTPNYFTNFVNCSWTSSSGGMLRISTPADASFTYLNNTDHVLYLKLSSGTCRYNITWVSSDYFPEPPVPDPVSRVYDIDIPAGYILKFNTHGEIIELAGNPNLSIRLEYSQKSKDEPLGVYSGTLTTHDSFTPITTQLGNHRIEFTKGISFFGLVTPTWTKIVEPMVFVDDYAVANLYQTVTNGVQVQGSTVNMHFSALSSYPIEFTLQSLKLNFENGYSYLGKSEVKSAEYVEGDIMSEVPKVTWETIPEEGSDLPSEPVIPKTGGDDWEYESPSASDQSGLWAQLRSDLQSIFSKGSQSLQTLKESGSGFFQFMQGLFGWLPPELTGMIIACLTVLLVIGLIKVLL